MAIFFHQGLRIPPSAETAFSKSKKTQIGYQSIVTVDNITVSTQEAGFAGVSLASPLTAEKWKPTDVNSTITIDASVTTDVNYIGIAAHTFARDRAVITIEHSIDSSTWTELTDISPADNKPIMIVFDTVSARYWRITIASSSPPSVGVLNIGTTLIMQRGIYAGHTPITMARQTKKTRNKTESGQFAGVSVISQGVSTSFSWTNLTSAWYRTNFDPFVVAARSKPFFIAWRIGEFPYEVGYVWIEGDPKPSNNGTRDLMDVSISVNGFSDE